MRVRNHIKSAVGKLSSHKQLSHDCLITNDFGQLTPVMAIPLLPRDKFRIATGVFSRVAPMIFPAYGSCDVVTNFHSVTYSQVWKDFDIYVTGQRYNGTKLVRIPVVTIQEYVTFIANNASICYNVESADSADITLSASGENSYYRLTLFGRYLRKVLTVLGYPFYDYIDYASLTASKRVFSLLPLLSFFKIYSDFYESRQYSRTSTLRDILLECYNGIPISHFEEFTMEGGIPASSITESSLLSLCSSLKLLYESDYFTSAQSFPNLVGGSQPLSFNINSVGSNPFVATSNLDQGGASQSGDSSQNRYLTNVVAGTQVSQTSPMHRLLDNFENLVRRFNLVGSREIDRIRSLFGIRPTVASQQYSTFIKSFSSPLKIQDVTSTSAEPSVDNYLGSYAGKGIVSDGSSFEVDSNDFGILIGVSFLKVRPLYNPGLNREVLKTSYTGYYNPEFDHGYSMAVSVGEVQTHLKNPSSVDTLFSVFGYQQAYDEYRNIPSRVYGDFLDSDLLPFSFVRDNVGIAAQTDGVIYYNQPTPSENNTDGVPDGIYSEFQRIFVDGSGRDHFYLYYSFNIDALRPVRTSSECFDLGVGDVSTSNNPVI